MSQFDWNEDKNKLLKQKRGVSFEEAIFAIQHGGLLDTLDNPNYSNQKMYIVNINEYAYVIPFVKEEEIIFLKTIFPSRKFQKRYLLGG